MGQYAMYSHEELRLGDMLRLQRRRAQELPGRVWYAVVSLDYSHHMPTDYYRLIFCRADDSAHESVIDTFAPLFVGFAAASLPLVRCGWRPWDPPCSQGGKALCVSRYIWGTGDRSLP
jgi:hypothetical protein